MNKKKKLFVRIICLILALIMVMGLVVQVAFATEGPCPYESNEGFSYIATEDGWAIQQEGENPVLKISNVPEDFPHLYMSVLVANIETNHTQEILLFRDNGYAATLELEDGYYLIYTCLRGFKDNDGAKYVINNMQTAYFYHGDWNVFEEKYDLNYIDGNGIIDLKLDIMPADYNTTMVGPNATYHLTAEEKLYPMDEIYNWDILASIVENIDVDALLEEGKLVYLESTDAPISKSEEELLLDFIQNNPIASTVIAGVIKTPTREDLNLDFQYTSDMSPVVGATQEDVEDVLDEVIEQPVEIPVETPVETTPTPEKETEGGLSYDSLVGKVEDKTGIDLSPDKTAGQNLLDAIIDSWFLLLALLGFGIAYFVVKRKNQLALETQLEDDRYDDGYIR